MSEQIVMISHVLVTQLAFISCFTAGCAKVVIPTGNEFTGETGGCGSFMVYRFNDDKTLAVEVRVDEKVFAVQDAPIEVEIAAGSKTAFVEVLQFRRPAISYFCDDVGGDAPPIATWKAVSGRIAIERYEVVPAVTAGDARHKVTVVLRNVRLRHVKSGQEATLSEVRIDDVLVGWQA